MSRTMHTEPFFTFRTGLRYRWWRSDLGTAPLCVLMIAAVMGMMVAVVMEAAK